MKGFGKRRRMAFVGIGVACVLILLYVGLAIYKTFEYSTTPAQVASSRSPADYGLAYETIAFPSAAGDSVTLRGWWVPKAESRKVIILVHGRDGNRTSYLDLAKPFWDSGYNVLLFDLRGHGLSDSTYCTWGIREQYDVIGAVNFARAHGIPPAGIGVIGWSLGAASAIMALHTSPDIKAVVSDSAYANADPLLAHNALYPGLVLGLRLIRDIDINQISPEKAISAIGQRHVFLIHGEKDSQAPEGQAERLQRAGAANVVQLWVVAGAGHVQAREVQPAEYVRRVTGFFDSELTP